MAKTYENMTVGKAVRIISDAMAQKGLSTKGRDQAIINAAGDFTAYCRSLVDVDRLPSTYYETKTREGNTEFRTYPAIKNLPSLSRSVRESMAAVGLTLESVVDDGNPQFPDVITR